MSENIKFTSQFGFSNTFFLGGIKTSRKSGKIVTHRRKRTLSGPLTYLDGFFSTTVKSGLIFAILFTYFNIFKFIIF